MATHLSLPFAAQPDIMRANQKDLQYLRSVREKITQVFFEMFGSRFQMKWASEINVLSDLVYFSLSTLAGSQTLGEEYCDIIQVHGSNQQSVTFMRRATLVFLHVLLPYFLDVTIKSWKTNRNIIPQENPTKLDELKIKIQENLPQFRKFLKEFLLPLHLCLFYFQGKYYNISKRIPDINYIFLRRLAPNELEQRPSYNILGFLISIQLLSKLNNFIKNVKKEETKPEEMNGNDEVIEEQLDFEVESQDKCTLCLERRKNSAATSCGHLFCWTCIVEWTHNKSECPLCRQFISLTQVYPVYNF